MSDFRIFVPANFDQNETVCRRNFIARSPVNVGAVRGSMAITRLLCAVFLTLLACALSLNIESSLTAQQRPTSLDIVPESTSFYVASMNHAAQYQALIESNAWQQLMDSEVATRMRKAYRRGRRSGFRQFGRDNPFALYLDGYAESLGSAPGKLAMNYLKGILGNEIFVFGDENWVSVSRSINELYKEISVAMASIDLEDMDQQAISRMLKLGREKLTGINTPRLVLGTVLDTPGQTQGLLQLAQVGIDELMTQLPDEIAYLEDAFEVIEEDSLFMLSLQLNGKDLPWEDLDGDRDFEPFLDDIKGILSDKSVNLSIAVKGKFLLVAIGPDNQLIKELGQGSLLIDQPRLAALKDAAKEHPITSVSYMSEDMARLNYDSAADMIDTALAFIELAVDIAMEDDEAPAELAGLPDELRSDAEELKKDLIRYMPKPGTYLGFSYMFEHGYEGFVYNWAENKYLDGSQPLDLVDHVGASPAFFTVSRDGGNTDQFTVVRKWVGRALDYGLKYGAIAIPNEKESRMFRDVFTEIRGVVSRLADTTQSNLLAATSGKQTGLVLDFSSARNSWHEMMPESHHELPIPSMAVLVEHDSKEKIVTAGSEFLKATRDIVETVRDIPGSNVPDEFMIPDPLNRSAFGGDLYYYEFPPQVGLDPSIAFHALVRDKLLILGYSMDQTERLASDKRPDLPALLQDPSKKAMTVTYYNNRELINALHTWFKYGLRIAKREGAVISMDQHVDNDTLAFQEAELLEALNRVLDLIKCFESASSLSYMEDGAQVTRYQFRFQDIQPAR